MLMRVSVAPAQHRGGVKNKDPVGIYTRSALVLAQLLVAVCTERSPPHVCVQACVFNRSTAMTQVRIARLARKLS